MIATIKTSDNDYTNNQRGGELHGTKRTMDNNEGTKQKNQRTREGDRRCIIFIAPSPHLSHLISDQRPAARPRAKVPGVRISRAATAKQNQTQGV